jgi:hypothetical protein
MPGIGGHRIAHGLLTTMLALGYASLVVFLAAAEHRWRRLGPRGVDRDPCRRRALVASVVPDPRGRESALQPASGSNWLTM